MDELCYECLFVSSLFWELGFTLNRKSSLKQWSSGTISFLHLLPFLLHTVCIRKFFFWTEHKIVSSQTFKRHSESDHFSPLHCLSFQASTICPLSFCFCVSCVPLPHTPKEPVQVRSCQSPYSAQCPPKDNAVEAEWLAPQGDSLYYSVYIWLISSMIRS